ncbi:MAG: hypothetical protein JWO95_1102 [Verrucomicrobiales bacterium]|nr:hypothetical protein [Verrucomicrobiales bacterium]
MNIVRENDGAFRRELKVFSRQRCRWYSLCYSQFRDSRSVSFQVAEVVDPGGERNDKTRIYRVDGDGSPRSLRFI